MHTCSRITLFPNITVPPEYQDRSSMDIEGGKRKADEIDEKKEDDKSGAEESEKKVKVSAAEQNAACHSLEGAINETLGYLSPPTAIPQRGLKAQREYIFSHAETPAANHSFSVAKAVFYRSILTDDSTKRLKYGLRFNSTLLAEYLDGAIFTCLKKTFGPMDPSVDLGQNIELLAESVLTKDNSHRQIAVLLVFQLLLKALWQSSVEDVALNAYEWLLIQNPDLPNQADLTAMMSQPSVYKVVSSLFMKDTSGEYSALSYVLSPLRLSVFRGTPTLGRYACGGLNILRDNDTVNELYELACTIADPDKSEMDIDDAGFEFEDNLTSY